ncbi:MAG: hypothetical protein HRT61_15150 [Ekhidna sp.]|nr:hypothetical protein [Ekhidna sp.]
MILSGADLDFQANKSVGNLFFSGPEDQGLQSLDTLFVSNMEVNKTGNLLVLSEQVYVSGSLTIASGVVKTDDIDDLIVTGESSEGGDGYVEGKLVGETKGNPITFPMGVNGFKNVITFSGTSSGVRLIVDCLVPESETLIPSDEMVGIADEVEWQVRTISGSTQATVTANFSGLDFLTFSNGEAIRANLYAPAIVFIQKEDTIYSLLTSSEATP